MAERRGHYTQSLNLRAASIALAVGIALLTLLAGRSAQAQTFTTLHSFDGTDGADPIGALVQATDGRLYGSTTGALLLGTIFKITPSGALTTLYNFCYGCGIGPGTLIQGTDGNFYGTTWNAEGTIFKFTPKNGTRTTLYDFSAQGGGENGEYPYGVLVQATDGNFYGTTGIGGAYGEGTLFKITPSGTLTTVYNFCAQTNCADGAYSTAGLLQGSDGNLYGTTELGGLGSDCEGFFGCGTVFKITLSGMLTTLYSFCTQSNCTDGGGPDAALIQATDGNFYGTTAGGGANTTECGGSGCGTVFKITPSGTLTTLYSFCSQSGCTDGEYPQAALIQATDGNLYGMTRNGGADNLGTVFRITLSGALTTLHTFDNTDGSNPEAGLVQDTNGTLYGTTVGGANNTCYGGCGTVFSLSVGLGPFVETQPTLGPAGVPVKILGTNLTGATSVTFNGTPAVFTVFSSSLIGAKVPAGATTGTVQVVTPSGTLSSNLPFRVRH